MALIPVRDPRTGTITEVTEAWLERWPDDFHRLDGDDLPADAATEDLPAAATTSAEPTEAPTAEAPADETPADETPSAAKHAAPVDPAVSSF